MNQDELIPFTSYLQVLTGDNATFAYGYVIPGISPNIGNLFDEGIGLPAAMDVTTDFK